MSLFNRIRDYFCPPKLRNKPDGLAWIRTAEGGGTEQLYGRVITTERADPDGFWHISPQQSFRATCWVEGPNGRSAPPGATVVVTRIHDDALEPIRNPGSDERSEELAWLPPVPAGEPRKVAA